MNQPSKRTKWLAAGGAAAALFGVGYLARTWSRYGKTPVEDDPDPLLDRFMPEYEVGERHEIDVRAPVHVTWAAARRVSLDRSRLIRAIFAAREVLMRASPPPETEAGSFLERVLALGWGVLVEEPGREIVLGAVTRPWEANVTFRSVPPAEFAGFAEPGYAKIAWTLAAEPLGPGRSRCSTETRVRTTDAQSRARFRRYWTVLSPGILLIRRVTLRVIRGDAERQARMRLPV